MEETTELTHPVSCFIVWLQDGEWHYSSADGLWQRYGYRSRTTQQLFEYYLKYNYCKATPV